MFNISSSGAEVDGDEEEPPDDRHIFDDAGVRTALIILYSTVFVFCFCGNLVVIIVTSFHWKMRNVTKFCLNNLAIANLCVGVFCIYQNLSLFLSNRWIFGNIMCKMYHFINSLSHTASILTLVVISVERYLVILHPLKSRHRITIHRLRILIIGVWLISGILCSPRLYYMVLLQHPMQGSSSNNFKDLYLCVPLSKLFNFKVADTAQFVLLFILPLLIITSLYTRIGMFLRERDLISSSEYSSDLLESIPNRERSPEEGISTIAQLNRTFSSKKALHPTMIRINYSQAKNGGGKPLRSSKGTTRLTSIYHPHKAVIKMLVAVVITFTVCNLPYHMRKMYQHYAPDPDYRSDLSDLLTPLTFLMMYCNCAITPFLYAFMSSNFIQCFLELITCKVGRGLRSSSVGSRRRNSL